MGSYFFDSSALVKRYHEETGTDVVERAFAETASTCVISRLGIVEVSSALALKVRVGDLEPDDYLVARKRLVTSQQNGSWLRT